MYIFSILSNLPVNSRQFTDSTLINLFGIYRIIIQYEVRVTSTVINWLDIARGIRNL